MPTREPTGYSSVLERDTEPEADDTAQDEPEHAAADATTQEDYHDYVEAARKGRADDADWKTWYQSQDATDIQNRADEKTKEWKNETQARWSDGVVTELGLAAAGDEANAMTFWRKLCNATDRVSERHTFLQESDPSAAEQFLAEAQALSDRVAAHGTDGGGDTRIVNWRPAPNALEDSVASGPDALKDLATAFRLPPEWRYGGHPVEDYRSGGHDRKEKVDALLVREAEGQYITVERMEADLRDLHEARDFLSENGAAALTAPERTMVDALLENCIESTREMRDTMAREAELTNMPGVVRHVGEWHAARRQLTTDREALVYVTRSRNEAASEG